MNRALFFPRCYHILIALAVLSVPFTSILYFFITPLLLLCWIFEGDWQRKWSILKGKNILIITCTFVLFWLINVIGLFYSNDLIRGIMRTYDKLPFLVYPLVFFTLDKNNFTKEKLIVLLKGFLCAATIMLLICWGNALIQYFATNKTHYFYYTQFSVFFGHPAYCTVIVTIAFFSAFFLFTKSTQTTRWLWGILSLFYGVSIYFLQMRSGIFAFLVILVLALCFYLFNHKKQYRQTIIIFSTVMIISVLLVKIFPNRVEKYVSTINDTEQIDDNKFIEKVFGLRSEIWHITLNLTMENKWLGIGTGYKNDEILEEDELKTIHTYSSFINAHNQFLQIFLEHGIFGLIIIFFLIGYSFYYAIKTKNYLLLMLLITFCINMFFESMLERNRGIFAFSLFYGLFMLKNDIFATVSKETLELEKS